MLAQLGAEFSGLGHPHRGGHGLTVRRAVGPDVRLVAIRRGANGLEVAKVLALGADLAGMALPLFRAQQEGGLEGADKALQVILAGLRQALVLTGSRSCAELRRKPVVVTGELKDWLAAL